LCVASAVCKSWSISSVGLARIEVDIRPGYQSGTDDS
jgi:hypothetical protein